MAAFGWSCCICIARLRDWDWDGEGERRSDGWSGAAFVANGGASVWSGASRAHAVEGVAGDVGRSPGVLRMVLAAAGEERRDWGSFLSQLAVAWEGSGFFSCCRPDGDTRPGTLGLLAAGWEVV